MGSLNVALIVWLDGSPMANVGYDPIRDFVPVSMLTTSELHR